jgi:hypothetical protein
MQITVNSATKTGRRVIYLKSVDDVILLFHLCRQVRTDCRTDSGRRAVEQAQRNLHDWRRGKTIDINLTLLFIYICGKNHGHAEAK